MGKWEGVIRAGDLVMYGVVHYKLAGFHAILGEWYGRGNSEDFWSPGEFETNIGKITVMGIRARGNGLFTVEFIGSDLPKGVLAEALGVQERN